MGTANFKCLPHPLHSFPFQIIIDSTFMPSIVGRKASRKLTSLLLCRPCSPKKMKKDGKKVRGKDKFATKILVGKRLSQMSFQAQVLKKFFTSIQGIQVFFRTNIRPCHSFMTSMEHGQTPLAHLASSLGSSPPHLDFFCPKGIIRLRDSIRDLQKVSMWAKWDHTSHLPSCLWQNQTLDLIQNRGWVVFTPIPLTHCTLLH